MLLVRIFGIHLRLIVNTRPDFERFCRILEDFQTCERQNLIQTPGDSCETSTAFLVLFENSSLYLDLLKFFKTIIARPDLYNTF